MTRTLISRLGLIALGLLLALALLEGALRLTFGAFTAYDVLYLEPDPVVGWKQVPNFSYTWTGHNCRAFAQPVHTNGSGFRDVAWQREKPPGTLRVALIGDSFVEAIQLPLEQTAAKVLERRLDEALAARVEVMNAGISNWGIGQYLAAYDAYIRPFHPDYVLIYAAYFHMERTARSYILGGHGAYALDIRPTYEIDRSGALVYHPPAEYDAFVAAVQKAIETTYGPDRSIALYQEPRSGAEGQLYLVRFLQEMAHRRARIAAMQDPIAGVPTPRTPSDSVEEDFPYVELNHRIVEALNARVQADGGRLVFIDAFRFWEFTGPPGNAALAARNRQLAERIGAGYIDLSAYLEAADAPVSWPCDIHYNPLGNAVFADAMFDWFMAELGK